jgi:uncharacterized damage-inducible protein DinB
MHPRTEEVLNYLDARRADLQTAVEAVPLDLRQKSAAPNQWSIAQVLDHLTMIDRRVGTGMKKWLADARAKGVGAETGTSSVRNSVPTELIIDRSRRFEAPAEIRPADDIDATAAWTALEQAREDLRSTFLSGDGLALAEIIQPHPVLGPINLYQWMLFVGSHEARHTGQIREIAGALQQDSTASASG